MVLTEKKGLVNKAFRMSTASPGYFSTVLGLDSRTYKVKLTLLHLGSSYLVQDYHLTPAPPDCQLRTEDRGQEIKDPAAGALKDASQPFVFTQDATRSSSVRRFNCIYVCQTIIFGRKRGSHGCTARKS